jgi:hypothetical protein
VKVAYIIEAKSEDALANLEFWMRESKVKFERVEGLGIALNDDPPPAPVRQPAKRRVPQKTKSQLVEDDWAEYDPGGDTYTGTLPGEVALRVCNTEMTVENNDRDVFTMGGRRGRVSAEPTIVVRLTLEGVASREVQLVLQAIGTSGGCYLRAPP